MFIHMNVLVFLLYWLNVARAFDCIASNFEKILPQNASLNIMGSIKQGGTFGDLRDLDFPSNATNLPPLCAVSIEIQLTDTSFNFGLFLPKTWNNRLIGTGNTGFGGGINWEAMGRLVYYDMVAFSTDSGHNSNPSDASWALGDNEEIVDWASRAMHDSLILAKQVVEAYYGDKISYSYYMACSGGGRQGMKEMQDYPTDFNGYAIGHPPWLLTHLHPWAAYVGKVNLPNTTASHISADLLSNLTQQVTDVCDPQDGVSDNIVMTPWTCSFNSSSLLCQNSTQTDCLTAEQLPTFNTLFSNWVDSNTNNSVVSPTLMLGADISGLAGADSGEPSAFGTEFVDYFVVNNSDWNYEDLSPATVELADSIDPGYANADTFDLSPFQATGGKVIHYRGLSDPLIPPDYSIYYWQQVQSAMYGSDAANSSLEDFYRLFLIPGMHHCSGSAGAPWFIAGGGQSLDEANYTHSVPGYMDAKHDVVLAVMDWVENGTAPDNIIATKWHEDMTSKGLSKQMPLCVYPAMAKYLGDGSIDDPGNWQCQNSTPAANVQSIPIASEGSVKINSTATSTTASTSTSTSTAEPKQNAAVTVVPCSGWTSWSLVLVALVYSIYR